MELDADTWTQFTDKISFAKVHFLLCLYSQLFILLHVLIACSFHREHSCLHVSKSYLRQFKLCFLLRIYFVTVENSALCSWILNLPQQVNYLIVLSALRLCNHKHYLQSYREEKLQRSKHFNKCHAIMIKKNGKTVSSIASSQAAHLTLVISKLWYLAELFGCRIQFKSDIN